MVVRLPVRKIATTIYMQLILYRNAFSDSSQVFQNSLRYYQHRQFYDLRHRQLNSFAGTAAYTARFKVDNQYNYLRIEKVNKGVAEIVLNGKEVGTNWYGTPVFYIKDAINKGDNELIIIYTTVLSNYVMSLKDNPTFSKWTSGYDKLPSGLEGNIVLTDSYY